MKTKTVQHKFQLQYTQGNDDIIFLLFTLRSLSRCYSLLSCLVGGYEKKVKQQQKYGSL
jgi:hypothetical protein